MRKDGQMTADAELDNTDGTYKPKVQRHRLTQIRRPAANFGPRVEPSKYRPARRQRTRESRSAHSDPGLRFGYEKER